MLNAERGARAAKQGLWVDLDTVASPVAPWEWRKAKRTPKTRDSLHKSAADVLGALSC